MSEDKALSGALVFNLIAAGVDECESFIQRASPGGVFWLNLADNMSNACHNELRRGHADYALRWASLAFKLYRTTSMYIQSNNRHLFRTATSKAMRLAIKSIISFGVNDSIDVLDPENIRDLFNMLIETSPESFIEEERAFPTYDIDRMRKHVETMLLIQILEPISRDDYLKKKLRDLLPFVTALQKVLEIRHAAQASHPTTG